MLNSALDKFGQLLMSEVRDRTIRQWKKIAEGRMKGEEALQLHEQFSLMTYHDQNIVMALAPEIIDIVLHNLLAMLEQEECLDISIRVCDKVASSLRDASDGLSGELYSSDGWIARFSRAAERECKGPGRPV